MKYLLSNKTVLKQIGLVDLLNSSLGGYKKDRSHKKVHASDITNEYKSFCPREYALLDTTKTPRADRYIGTAMQVAFDNGEDLHDRVRDDWLRTYAVGDWRCPHCNHKVIFSKAPKVPCPKCGDKNWRYSEVVFDVPTFGISGSIDFIVDLGRGKHSIVEIKSMDKDQFNELAAPLSEHRIRTCLYLHMIKEHGGYAGRIDTEKAYILYVSKGFGVKHADMGKVLPFKEFQISSGAANIDVILKPALDLKVWREKEVKDSYPKGVCSTVVCSRAKQCSVSKQCFSGVYPNNPCN